MGLDIRLPIGLMFSLVGVLLVFAGLTHNDPETLKRSLDININLYWGLFLVVFGGIMLAASLLSKNKAGNGQ